MMQTLWGPLLDLCGRIVLFLLEVTILRAVLRWLCRHSADTSFFKAALATIIVGGVHGVITGSLKDPLGPVAVAGALLAAWLVLRFLCWTGWREALVAGSLYAAIAVTLGFGYDKVADQISPTRVTFLTQWDKSSAVFSKLQRDDKDPISWQWMFARILQAVAIMTRPDEMNRLQEDTAKGMEFYHQRKQELAAKGGGAAPEGQPVVFSAIETLSTSDLSRVQAAFAAMQTRLQAAPEPPPQAIRESFAQIQSNLTSEAGRTALIAMLNTGVSGAKELVADGREFQTHDTNVLAHQAMLRQTILGLMSNLPPASATGTVAVAATNTALAQAPEAPPHAAPTAEPAPPAPTTTASAIPSGAKPSSETPDRVLDRVTLPIDGFVSPSFQPKVHGSYRLLKQKGRISSGGNQAVLCNGKVVSVGASVTVEYEGQSWTWQLESIGERYAVWSRCESAETESVIAW